MNIIYYQCDNPDCGLRFPHHAEIDLRCPKCLGRLSSSDRFEVSDENQSAIRRGTNHAVILDNIRSGFNVGAIIRTAECFGIAKIALGGITPGENVASVRKTSLRAEERITFSHSNRSMDLVEEFRSRGYAIWALEITPTAENLFTITALPEKIALVVGNERCGVDPRILATADKTVMLPMFGEKRSLNVEVSFGVALGCILQKS